LDTQSRVAYAWQQGEQEGHKEGEQWKSAEILKLFEAGFSVEDIKDRLKAVILSSNSEKKAADTNSSLSPPNC
jgi:hypothetical protein